jgi:hypothetical protein
VRHLRSILISLPLGALVWIAIGVGVDKMGRALGQVYFGQFLLLRGSVGPLQSPLPNAIFAVVVFILAGLLYSVLLLADLSPVGPAAVAVAYAGVSVWAMAAPASFEGTFAADVFELSRAAQAPAWGYTMLLAVPLALASARWRPLLGGQTQPLMALTPLIWLLAGVGIYTMSRTVGSVQMGEGLLLAYQRDKPPLHNPVLNGVISVLTLLAAGLLTLILLRGGTRRVGDGPRVAGTTGAGVGVVGLGFAVVSLFAIVAAETFDKLLHLVGLRQDDAALQVLVAPVWGYALLLAVPMLAISVRAILAAHSAPDATPDLPGVEAATK